MDTCAIVFLTLILFGIGGPVYAVIVCRRDRRAAATASAIGAGAVYVLSVLFRFDAALAGVGGISEAARHRMLSWRIGVWLALSAFALAVTSIGLMSSRLPPGAGRKRFAALSSIVVILITLVDVLLTR